jgi:hypothetical protein
MFISDSISSSTSFVNQYFVLVRSIDNWYAICCADVLSDSDNRRRIFSSSQLTDSVKDRKFASELRNIQSMIGSIQSEHAQMHEQRIKLMTENGILYCKLEFVLYTNCSNKTVTSIKLPCRVMWLKASIISI